MRGLEENTINEIVCLMKMQTYEQGDDILMRYKGNDKIIILWQGEVQVRVERLNPKTNKFASYWFHTV